MSTYQVACLVDGFRVVEKFCVNSDNHVTIMIFKIEIIFCGPTLAIPKRRKRDHTKNYKNDIWMKK